MAEQYWTGLKEQGARRIKGAESALVEESQKRKRKAERPL
jgi:hypothetical protein